MAARTPWHLCSWSRSRAATATIGLPGETSFTGSSVQILGIETTGPAGTLPPGYQGTLLIPYESTTLVAGASINFSLQVMTGDSTPMNWSSLESSLQPSYMSATAWKAVFANLTANLGSTTETYLAALDNEATYLSQLGEYTDDVQRLFGFAINIANDAATSGSLDSVTDASFPVPGAIPLEFDRQFNPSISGRDTLGPFGYGWTDNWQIAASADSQGNVTISDDGSLLYFAKQSDGSYLDAPGEYGTLTLVSGAYQYVQTDGTIIAFNTNGTLNYEQDANGNRITAGYNSSGELTSLTASNGSAITIQYNAQGLISQIIDPAGQSTTYTYDANGQHLLTFTDEFGRTTYTYATGPTAADANALTSLTFADGTGIEWSYDAHGRLASTGRLDGAAPEAEVLTYTYPNVGGYAITDADGNTTTHLIDDAGNCCTIIDPLGNITRYSFDANDNLVEVVVADGTTTTYSYDANGNMTSETDPLGYTIHFTYNAFGEPLTFVNQEGYTTTYQYDANGNLLETVNPDGTAQQYVYNSLGEVTSSTDPDGQTITYTYNNNAQLTAEDLPDGTSDTYTYDSFGNMLTADSPSGNWSFTYNSQNLPTKIVEPNGTLTVQYGIDGNVTQIVDQTGFTVNYLYDAVGRLANLTDANGNLIESYTYDAAGNVISETKGNGTSTTYQYNADGAVTEITNLAPGGAINSQMAYAYNAVGEVASMTTGGVTTTYGYDADGELTSASSPGDTILYAYDPDGNRTSVTDNGVVTDYTSNSMNEYTQVGDTTYQYDANGNLIAATTNGQTTSYTFNVLNQLTGVSGPNGTFSYTYDALGYQISSTINGQARRRTT
jgi:YD repeat-containing protein